MAKLPDLNLLADSGLNGLEQYLLWCLTETRRLAIAEGNQQAVRLTIATGNYQYIKDYIIGTPIKFEVNLKYDSPTALAQGLRFINTIKEVSTAEAALPSYRCSTRKEPKIDAKIREIANGNTAIDTLEKLLFWLCASWQTSQLSITNVPENSVFQFIEEDPSGASFVIRGKILISYINFLTGNIVCGTEPYFLTPSLQYQFASYGRASYIDSTDAKDNSAGNNSSYGNNSELGN